MVVLAKFIRLQQAVLAMQAAAEAQDWDRFVLLQEDYLQIAADLPQQTALAVSESEQAQLAVVMQQTQAALNVVLPLAQARHAMLAGELAGVHNAGKLNRTYQP